MKTPDLPEWLWDYVPLLFPHLAHRFKTPGERDVRDAIARSTIDFFISYRQVEAETYAERLAKELGKLGYNVFHAGGEAIPTDESLMETLRTELHRSSVLSVIGSADAFGGDWVRWELEAFEENHWGRMVPIVTDATTEWNKMLIAGLRRIHASVLHEEDEGVWEAQQPSPLTVLNMALAREFFRVEMDFWVSCGEIPEQERLTAYFDALTNDRVCRTLAHVLRFPDRQRTLLQMQEFGMATARGERRSGLLGRMIGSFLEWRG